MPEKPCAPAGRPAADGARVGVVVVLLLVLLTVAVYGHARENGFVNYDDPLYVTDNTQVQAVAAHGLTATSAAWAFRTLEGGNWHPLTWLSLLLDAQLSPSPDPDPRIFHLTNVVLHTANTILLFAFLRWTTALLWPAAFTATLFAIHPLHVESVAWVSERKDVLSTLFWMLTMLAYAWYARRPGLGRYLAMAGAFVLGLLSKPMLVTLPCVLLLLDAWPLRRLKAGWRRLVIEKIPLLVLSAGICLVTVYAQRSSNAMADLGAVPLPTRIGNAFLAYASYLVQNVWPTGLVPLYPRPVLRVPPAVAAGGLIAVSALAWHLRRQLPCVTVGWLWYLGTLVPVIGLVQVGLQAMADRYTYIPLIGIFLALAYGAADLVRRWRAPELAVGLGVLAIGGCTLLTWLQVFYWQDSVTLWTHAVEVNNQSPTAHMLLGGALWKEADQLQAAGLEQEAQTAYRKSIASYRACVEQDEHYAQGHFNLGVGLYKQGGQAEIREGLAHMRRAIELEPKLAKASYNLGLALSRLGDPVLAEAQFLQVLKIQPDNPAAWDNLGRCRQRLGRWEEAASSFAEAVRLKPDVMLYRCAYAFALEHVKRAAAAADQYGQAARLDPQWRHSLAEIAWQFATRPGPLGQRDPLLGLELADQVVAFSGGKDFRGLEARAAAHADLDQWDAAVADAGRAKPLAKEAGDRDGVRRLDEALILYRRHEPFREYGTGPH